MRTTNPTPQKSHGLSFNEPEGSYQPVGVPDDEQEHDEGDEQRDQLDESRESGTLDMRLDAAAIALVSRLGLLFLWLLTPPECS